MGTGATVGIVIAVIGILSFFLFNRWRTLKLLRELHMEAQQTEHSTYSPPPIQPLSTATAPLIYNESPPPTSEPAQPASTQSTSIPSIIDELKDPTLGVGPGSASNNRFSTFYKALNSMPASNRRLTVAPNRKQTVTPSLAFAETRGETVSGGTVRGGTVPSQFGQPPQRSLPQPVEEKVGLSLDDAKIMDGVDRVKRWAREEFQRQKQYLDYILDEVEVIDDEPTGQEFLTICKKLKLQMALILNEIPQVFQSLTYPEPPSQAATRLLALQLTIDWQVRILVLQLVTLHNQIAQTTTPAQLVALVKYLKEFGRVLDE